MAWVEEPLARLAEAILLAAGEVEAEEPEKPTTGPRVSKALAEGGARGRWLVIFGDGRDEGPYTKEVARKVLRARRRVAPGSNAWMLNIDGLVGIEQFDAIGARAYLTPWLAHGRHYYLSWRDRSGEPRIEGPFNFLDAKFRWLETPKTERFQTPLVLDANTGVVLFPRHFGRAAPPRTNPRGRTPTLIRHMVVSLADAIGEGDPIIAAAELVRRAHAIAWSTAQESGLVQAGTIRLTDRGRKVNARHEAEPKEERRAKDARYEELLLAARTRYNPTGVALSGVSEVADLGGAVRTVVLYRPAVRQPGQKKPRRPRLYLDPSRPEVFRAVAGATAMRDLTRAVADAGDDVQPFEVVPSARRKKKK